MVKLTDPDLAKLFLLIPISANFSIGTLNLCCGNYILFDFCFYFWSFSCDGCFRLLAPYISSGIFWEVVKLWSKGYKVIVLDVPLLFEAKIDKFTKPIIVVWVDPETQIQRLLARDKSSEEDGRNRVNAQMPLDVKRTEADIVIDNTSSLDDLNEQFQNVLVRVNGPLTWCEFWLSRQGVSIILASLTSGVVLCMKAFNNSL